MEAVVKHLQATELSSETDAQNFLTSSSEFPEERHA